MRAMDDSLDLHRRVRAAKMADTANYGLLAHSGRRREGVSIAAILLLIFAAYAAGMITILALMGMPR